VGKHGDRCSRFASPINFRGTEVVVIGLGADFDIIRTRVLWMNLIKGSSKQLKGKLRVESTGGLKIGLMFHNSVLVKSFANQALPG
jgi:hypothetical protein